MADYRGGCLCGALRYAAEGPPAFQGLCYCPDCRKASGSGFVPFIGFPASTLHVTGAVQQVRSRAIHGGEAVRNRCAACGSLVFGGVLGETDSHTVYAGTLDDPSLFAPEMAIFVRARPAWATVRCALSEYAAMPA